MKKPFNRIVTVMFENQYRNYVIQNPFLKKLASAGADMTNYFGAFHPSQTNYLASFAGEICGVTNDNPPEKPLMQQTLVDLLEAQNVSWKAYMEGYPGDPWNDAWTNPDYPSSAQPLVEYPPAGAKDLTRYYRKHNAFASFHTIQKDKNRWSKIVGDTEFWQDIANDTLPEYSWFTPDIWNDGHYLYNTHIDSQPRTGLVPQVSAWLEYVFFGNIKTSKIQGGSETGLDNIGFNLDIDLLLTDPNKAWAQSNVPEGTLIVVTFDEADFDAVGYDTAYDGPNQIYTVLLGDIIAPGTTISTPYNHYNLIRTVEENYQLGSLNKNDEGANWFRFLWDEKFSWGSPMDTQFASGKALGITQRKESSHLVFSDANGQLFESFLDQSGWSTPKQLDFSTEGSIALVSIDDYDILILTGYEGDLMTARYNWTTREWTAPFSLGQRTAGSCSLLNFYDFKMETNRLMLCWQSDDGFIQSLTGDSNGFSNEVISVGQLTDGPMALGQLGASVYLVYKERNSRKMRITSYNVGPFNKFDAKDFNNNPAPEDDTTIHQWSPADYVVGHFSRKMGALANEYQNLGQMTMATVSGEMHLVHRGGYQDLSNAYTEIFGLTGICTAANQLTNGYGTLDQAGWTLEEEMTMININPESPLASASNNDEIFLVWADAQSKTIKYMKGGYRSSE